MTDHPPVSNEPDTAKPKLLDQVRQKCRLLHYAWRTEESYVQWIRRFILFHGKRHPLQMGNDVTTTMIHTHVLQRGARDVVSPLDRI